MSEQNALDNILTPASEIAIAGKIYKLVFDFCALAEIEEKTNRNLLTESGWDNLNGSAMGIFFWATLQLHHPEITLTQARRLMNRNNVNAIEKALVQAWTLAKPEEKPATDQNPQ